MAYGIRQISTGKIVYREDPFTDKTLQNASTFLGIDVSDLEQTTITDTDEQQEAKQARRQEILAQIAELDLKTIRPIREDGIKDEETGETWLEYYQSQITALRAEYDAL